MDRRGVSSSVVFSETSNFDFEGRRLLLVRLLTTRRSPSDSDVLVAKGSRKTWPFNFRGEPFRRLVPTAAPRPDVVVLFADEDAVMDRRSFRTGAIGE